MSRTNLATVALLLGAVLLAGRIAIDRLAGWRFVYVADTSMAPDIPMGALAGLHLVSVNDVDVGDVLLYASPNEPGPAVLLRVREERAPRGSRGTGRLFRLQSDASVAGSGAPPWDAELHGAVWRLSFVIPGMGWLAFIDPSAAVNGAVIAASAVLFFVMLWGITRSARRPFSLP